MDKSLIGLWWTYGDIWDIGKFIERNIYILLGCRYGLLIEWIFVVQIHTEEMKRDIRGGDGIKELNSYQSSIERKSFK